MSNAIIEFFRQKLAGAPPLPPLERALAKRWVLQRLKEMYPELAANPRASEEAYRALSLEPRPGAGEGGATVFEVILPEKAD